MGERKIRKAMEDKAALEAALTVAELGASLPAKTVQNIYDGVVLKLLLKTKLKPKKATDPLPAANEKI